MSIDLLTTILSAIASLALGGAFSTGSMRRLLLLLVGRSEQPHKPYTQRLAESTDRLTSASREVDALLAELAEVAGSKQATVKQLESNLSSLESRAKALKGQITALQNTPLPVADRSAQSIEKIDRRNVRRDYLMFGAGVLVTTLIAIVIQVFVE